MGRVIYRSIVACVVLTVSASTATSQNSLSIGVLETRLKSEALRYAFEHIPDLATMRHLSTPKPGSSIVSAFTTTFSVTILSGGKDAFDGAVAKVSGNYYPRLKVGPMGIDNEQHIFVIPFSLGIETNSDASRVNALAEIGFVPIPRWSLERNQFFRIAAFVQTGYKFDVSTVGADTSASYLKDATKELPDRGVTRLKGEFKLNHSLPLAEQGVSLNIVLEAIGWFDAVHGKGYRQIRASGVINYSKDIAYEIIKYEGGAGAPTFNTGDQWSSNLILKF